MDGALLNAGASAAGAVALVFLGSWETARQNRRAEARKDTAEDRAALEAQADELLAAVLAVRGAGKIHDHLWGGWRARTVVLLRAAVRAGGAYGQSVQRGFPAALASYGDAVGEIARWDRESAMSAAQLAGPLARLGVAVAPLLRRQEPGLATAAQEVLTALVDHYKDEDRTTRALAAFHESLRGALEQPVVTRRGWALRRGRGSS